jgi:hypothetical protein
MFRIFVLGYAEGSDHPRDGGGHPAPSLGARIVHDVITSRTRGYLTARCASASACIEPNLMLPGNCTQPLHPCAEITSPIRLQPAVPELVGAPALRLRIARVQSALLGVSNHG